MTPADVPFAAALHLSSLHCGLFPRLGKRFMAGYYRTFLDSPHALAFTAVCDGRTAGILVGTTSNAAHYRWVLRHRAAGLGLRAALALLVRPTVAGELVRSRVGRYARAFARLAAGRPAAGQANGGGAGAPVAVLTHVAVDGPARGAGIGGRLTEAFLESASHGPAEQAQLVTVAGEDGASRVWEAQGWEAWGSHVTHGCTMNRYRRPLR